MVDFVRLSVVLKIKRLIEILMRFSEKKRIPVKSVRYH